MKQQQKHNDAGFTLIEVMIALLVFSVGVLAMAQLQIASIQGNTKASMISEAAAFGSDIVEQMRYWDYNDSRLNSSNDSEEYTLSSDGVTYTADGHVVDSSGLFDGYWDVTTNSPVANSSTINITVIWELKGEQKTLSLTTVKTT